MGYWDGDFTERGALARRREANRRSTQRTWAFILGYGMFGTSMLGLLSLTLALAGATWILIKLGIDHGNAHCAPGTLVRDCGSFGFFMGAASTAILTGAGVLMLSRARHQ